MAQRIDAKREYLEYIYRFQFSDGFEKEFSVFLEKKTLNLKVPENRGNFPDWTCMESFQCPNCPLDKAVVTHCPIAVNVADLVEVFKDSISYEEALIRIECQERIIEKRTALQNGIGSLIGIYMSTSGCPVMDKLKPMVRMHLPFASLEETVYRVTSMYLLGQYFRSKNGLEPDWELRELKNAYAEVQIVNENFSRKLSQMAVKDASINAVVLLDTFAAYVPLSIETHLGDISVFFKTYWENHGEAKAL